MDDAIIVKFGRLRRVVGRAARCGDFAFVPVWFDFDHEPCTPHAARHRVDPAYPLSAVHQDQPPAILAACVDEFDDTTDALWVRGRIPAVFKFGPATLVQPECKYSLIEHVFVACRISAESGPWEAIPFVCVSHDLRTGLAFSPDGPGNETQRMIADAFWNLLLSDPGEISSYKDGYLSEDDFDDWFVVAECTGDRFLIDHVGQDDFDDEER